MSVPAVVLALCALIPAGAAAAAFVLLRRPAAEHAPSSGADSGSATDPDDGAASWTRCGRSEIGAPSRLRPPMSEPAQGRRR